MQGRQPVIKNAAGVTARHVKAWNKGIRILHGRDCALDDIDLKNGEFLIEGQTDGSKMESAPNLNMLISKVAIDNGYVDLHNCRGLTCEGVRVTHPVDEGIRISRIFSSHLDGIWSSEGPHCFAAAKFAEFPASFQDATYGNGPLPAHRAGLPSDRRFAT